MDALSIINIIAQVVKTAADLGPVIIKDVEDATPFAEAIYNHLVNKKPITQSDLDALDARIANLSEQLQAPLPPEQPDDV